MSVADFSLFQRMFLSLPPLNKPEIIGDLLEEYNIVISEVGLNKAKIWLWKQIILSFSVLLQRNFIRLYGVFVSIAAGIFSIASFLIGDDFSYSDHVMILAWVATVLGALLLLYNKVGSMEEEDASKDPF